MDPMRWFRKNNKKLLAVIAVLLMVGFLLPNFAGRNQRNMSDQIIGSATEPDGTEQKISSAMLSMAHRDLQTLRSLGLDSISKGGVLSMIGELGAIGQLPSLMAQQLLLPDPQFGQRLRGELYNMIEASDWAKDRQQAESLAEKVNRLTEVESAEAALCYILLGTESHRAGVRATGKQINAFMGARKELINRQYLPAIPLKSVCSQNGITESDMKKAVGTYLSILRYGNMATRPPAISEPQLKKAILDRTEIENIAGTYVSFGIDALGDKIAEPSEQEIAAQFESYKGYRQGQTDDDNPHGAGYFLPDRVQVEYLRIPIKQVQELIDRQFEALPIGQQEEKIRQYWSDNRERFKVEIETAVPEQTDPAVEQPEQNEPQWRYQDFDEVYTQAKRLWQQQQMRYLAEQALVKAKQLASQTATDSTADYAAIAEQVGTEDIKLEYGKSEFLSIQAASKFLEFERTYRMRGDQPVRPLISILFDCEPIVGREAGRLEEPRAKLNENIGPLMAMDFAREYEAAFLMRIVAVDKARDPVAINDDGTKGPAANHDETTGGTFSKRIAEDWKNARAFELARQKAERFAGEAAGDWDKAVKTINEAAADDSENIGPAGMLREMTLETARQQVQQFSQMEQYRHMAIGPMMMLKEAMKLAQRPSSDTPLPILNRPESFSVLVFKRLTATPPDKAEYLRHRPLVAQQLIMGQQSLLALEYFDPENIKLRNGYKENTNKELD